MQIERELKVKEAVKRMKALHIYDDAINQFIKDGVVMVSEPPLGGLYWIDDDLKQLVQQFEQKHNALVYFVIRCYSTIGKMDSFLYVSDYNEEWELDNEDVSEGYVMTYTHNYDAHDCSEFGSIGVKGRFGGLIRTA